MQGGLLMGYVTSKFDVRNLARRDTAGAET